MKRFFIFIAFFPFFFACEKPEQIGAGLITDNQINTLFTDSLSVQVSSLMLDSTKTYGTGIALIGSNVDATFGRTDVSAFVQVSPYGGAFTIDSTGAVYDSLVLYLPYKTTFGDTLKKFNFSIYQLSKMVDTTGTYRFTNKDDIPYNKSSLLAKASFYPRKYKDLRVLDTVKIRLSDKLGKELLSKASTTDASSANLFCEYFKGIVFANDPSNSAILSFYLNTSSAYGMRMRLHFHLPSGIGYYKEFVPYRSHFNQIKIDRNGTKYSALRNPTDILSSLQTNGEVIMQNGGGVGIKINMPYLKNFKNAANLIVNKAELVIQPNALLSPNETVPPSFYLIEVDSTNNIRLSTKYKYPVFLPIERATLIEDVNPFSSTGASTIGNYIQTVSYSNAENVYRVALTSYLQALMLNRRKNTGLVMIPTSQDNVSRMLLNSKNVKLNVYYTYAK